MTVSIANGAIGRLVQLHVEMVRPKGLELVPMANMEEWHALDLQWKLKKLLFAMILIVLIVSIFNLFYLWKDFIASQGLMQQSYCLIVYYTTHTNGASFRKKFVKLNEFHQFGKENLKNSSNRLNFINSVKKYQKISSN